MSDEKLFLEDLDSIRVAKEYWRSNTERGNSLTWSEVLDTPFNVVCDYLRRDKNV